MPHPPSNTERPSALVLPIRSTVKGRFRWEVLDESGQPEQAVTPQGELIHGTGVWHDNLITNRGLDQIATERMDAIGDSSFSLRRYLAVGEGSAVPAFTDTALAAEVQRAGVDGGLGQSNSYEYDAGNAVFRMTSTSRRVITMNANRNLTEYGLDPDTGAGVSIRELLRDGVGNPITVALLSGKSLRVDHELVYEAPAVGTSGTFDLEEYDAGNNLVSTTPISYDIAIGLDGDSYNFLFQYALSPRSPSNGVARISVPGTVSPTAGFSGTLSGEDNGGQETYVNGNHYVDNVRTFTPAQENGDWYGYMVGYPTQNDLYGHIYVQFTSPTTITKVNTHTLKVGVRLSWARA